MNDTEIPGVLSPTQSKVGFFIFFLSAFGIALYFALRMAGIDALTDRGPEVVEKKSSVVASSCSSWGRQSAWRWGVRRRVLRKMLF